MLVRITWGLLLAGLAFLIVGFLTDDSNVFLIISIVIELAVIVLVLGAWARRAREASAEGFAEVPTLSAEPEEDELYASLSDDEEEFAVGGRRPSRAARRPARRPAPKKTGAKPAAKPKAKPAAERTAKLKPAKAKPAKAKSSKAKSSKPKGAARKAKSKAKPKSKAAGTAPKAKPARRRPPAR